MLCWAFAWEPENMGPTLNQEEPNKGTPLVEGVLIGLPDVLLNQEEDDEGLPDVLLSQEEFVLVVEGPPNQEGPPVNQEELDVAGLCRALTNNGFAAC